ncbi:MAG: hypothetical protein VW397_07820 [Candidatus Margulisiibacteriota bacterium]
MDARAGGMGGSYIALSDTLIGAYYNPAGLGFIEQDRISESSNIYRSTSLKYSGPFDYELTTSSSVPPFIGFFQNFDSFNFAFSIITPRSDSTNQDITDGKAGSLTYTQNFDSENTHLLVGPSIGMLLNDNLAIGGSFFYSYETRNYVDNVYSYYTANPNAIRFWDNTYNEETMHELLGILGIQWMPNDQLSVGAKVNIPYCLDGDGTQQTTRSHTYFNTPTQNVSTISNGTYDLKSLGYRSNYPQIGTGIVYFISPDTLVSVDINYLISTPTSTDFPTQDTLNVAIGLEHYWQPYLPTRFGIYTNNAYFSKDANGEQINAIGIASSIGYEFGSNKLNLGIDYQFGTGEYKTSAGDFDLNYSGLSILISGSTSI